MRDIYFGPDATKLHGVVMHSDTVGAPAAIICHPHPQYGGNMNNNVVLGVEKELFEGGFTTLRFNFRGVGRSRGIFDNGIGEKDDVLYAIEEMQRDGAVGGIVVVGYSFGAAMALPVAAEHDAVKALAGISPPTVLADFKFLTSVEKPMLIVAGSSDEFCDATLVKSYVTQPNHTFEILPGVDHFYFNEELRVGKLVCDFMKRLVKDKVI